MATPKKRLLWRGRLRALLRDLRGDVSSAQQYDATHPDLPWMDSSTQASMIAIQSWITTKLSQTTVG